MAPVRVGGSRFCVLNARGTTQQDVLVTDQGLLRNVVVYVRSGQKPLPYKPPSNPPSLINNAAFIYLMSSP